MIASFMMFFPSSWIFLRNIEVLSKVPTLLLQGFDCISVYAGSYKGSSSCQRVIPECLKGYGVYPSGTSEPRIFTTASSKERPPFYSSCVFLIRSLGMAVVWQQTEYHLHPLKK